MQFQEINPRCGDFMVFDLLDPLPNPMIPEIALNLSFIEFEALTNAWMTATQIADEEITNPSSSAEQYEQAVWACRNLGSYPLDTLSMFDDYQQYKVDNPEYAQLVAELIERATLNSEKSAETVGVTARLQQG